VISQKATQRETGFGKTRQGDIYVFGKKEKEKGGTIDPYKTGGNTN